MQADPLVCAIMLTRDRPEMAARAVRCFREQTYKNRVLQIWSTSGFPDPERDRPANEFFTEDVPDYSIGELRNRANDWHNAFDAAILIHWDDDDWSHPNRIAEQVALLQSSCADAVGYNQVLCWDTTGPGEAWVYSNGNPSYAMGATLAYWRETWERNLFGDISKGEDNRFLQAILNAGGSVAAFQGFGADSMPLAPLVTPRLIYSIHGGNTWQPDFAEAAAHGSDNWRRAPEWDEYARKVMTL